MMLISRVTGRRRSFFRTALTLTSYPHKRESYVGRDKRIVGNEEGLTFMLDQGEWALGLHRLSHSLYRAGHLRAARCIWKLVRIVTTIDIHPGARLGKGVKLPHPNGIVIAEFAWVGDNVTILQQVTIGVHKPQFRFTEANCARICNNVVLGSGCRVLGAITIGDSAVVGANAVVLIDIPPSCTAVGLPARVIFPREAGGSSSEY
jgi:serine O-acetyltransferase